MIERATRWLGRLLGREDLTQIDEAAFSFGASWAHEGPGWVLLAIVGVAIVSVWFYFRRQSTTRSARVTLAVLRGVVLSLIVLILAEPVLELRYTDEPKPLLWLLADASDSMNLPMEAGESPGAATRADRLRNFLADGDGVLAKLGERFRIESFTFDRPDSVRSLDLENLAEVKVGLDEEEPQASYSPTGTVTAIGSAIEDLRRRSSARDLAGVLVFSDFVQNAGPSATKGGATLDVPIFAVGLGATAAADLAVDLDAEPTVKKAERVTFTAIVRQVGLTGSTANLRLTATPADGSGTPQVVGQKEVSLDAPQTIAEFAITPEEVGRFVYTLEADELPDETVAANNTASRNVMVTDDYLRLLFVEYEPTWEWRFVKEVFHRDRLVGLRGFRTYLRSSDPAVRKTNELFLETLPPPRDEFFQYDVIFLGDVPASALPDRFGEMTKEFVSQFGGGLVVMGGPRFGPQELAQTPLAEMLPVVVDRDARRRDEAFRPVLTPAAAEFDFMQLGDDAVENRMAWQNMGELPWYQPVQRIESTSVVLAEHPSDTTSDGRTRQPLIARRQYGAAGGEVVYLGFNETWRLRRKFGEKYYRQFWGQLIYRLGLGHARGADKRFVIDPLPDEPFRPDEEIAFTVRAWDRNFERLTENDVPNGSLKAELVRVGAGGGDPTPLTLAMSRPGVFEARVPAYQPGDYQLRVVDPITSDPHEARFSIADLSVERRVPNRDANLQRQLAAVNPDGRALELDGVASLLDDFNPPRRTRVTTDLISLWDTWLVFGLVVGLLLIEWTIRKAVHLA